MRKNILILMSSLNAAGAEKQTICLINHMDRDRFSITLRYFDRREALLGDIDMTRMNSVDCFDRRGRFDLSILKKLGTLLDHDKHHLVLCIGLYPMLYAYLVRLLFRLKFKLVTAIHYTVRPRVIRERIKEALYKRLLNTSDLLVFVCRSQMAYWVTHHNVNPERCRWIYNGINTDYFAPNRMGDQSLEIARKYNISESDIVLGNVAGFRLVKKQEDIIQAAKILRDGGYPIKVLLVGEGPRRLFLEQYIDSCGIKEHVILSGLQKDVRPFLHLMDCFVISSNQEAFSIAALEAMAAGKPLVMTDTGGAGEMVEAGVNGFLFAPGDIPMLVEKTRYLIDHDSFEEMGNNSRKIVTERFTLEKMVHEYEDTFSKL
jgi:glycosyltransferase involved in cell wall biosynthesis